MELCQHDEFYKQHEKQFTIKGNSKTGKLLVGMSIEERQGCMYDCDSSEDSDCE